MLSFGAAQKTIKVEAGVPARSESSQLPSKDTIITFLEVDYPTEVTVHSAITIKVRVRQLRIKGPWNPADDPDTYLNAPPIAARRHESPNSSSWSIQSMPNLRLPD
jgi:hypothetical protein